MKKITICASVAFIDEMESRKKALEAMGHEVRIPDSKFSDGKGNPITIKQAYQERLKAKPEDSWVWDEKELAMINHFEKIAWADMILVLNYDKKGYPNYIGGNTLMEMGVALHLQKPIYLHNPIPEMHYSEEIRGMKPVIIYGDLNLI